MQVFNFDGYSVYGKDAQTKSCVLALGIFDGVHIAHKELLQRAIALKKRLGAARVGAWCFHSLGNTPQICSAIERVDMLIDCGIDFVVVADFSAFRNMTANAFMTSHLRGTLGCIGVVCGFNFRFGQDRLGSPEDLVLEFGEASAAVVDEIKIDGVTVSSSEIRRRISDGDVSFAATLLGRYFSHTSKVSTGKQLGRTIGFPTANQFFEKDSVIPKSGIYATLCTAPDGKKYIGVTNIGVRPSIKDGSDSHVLNCETFLCGFEGDLYGKPLRVEFCKRLRDEHGFDSIEQLKDAITRDTESAIKYFYEEGSKI